MDLERLSLRLRPRNDWEAVDLGLAMVRAWMKPIYQAWLVVMLPLALLLTLGLGTKGWLIFWWLLPVGQAAVLRTLSRRVFGQPPLLKETLRALPGLWRRGLAEFGLRRLHPARSLRLAVGQLEGLSGADRRRRVAVLSSRGQEAPGGLPLIFMVFEVGLVLALIALALLMMPDGLGFDEEQFTDRFLSGESPAAVYRTFWLIVALALLVIDPLYIGVGFALYLNRRTQLEGWDLEIAFRRLMSRLGPLLPDVPASPIAEPVAESAPKPSESPPPVPTAGGISSSTVLGLFGLLLFAGSLTLPDSVAAQGETPSAELVLEETVEDGRETEITEDETAMPPPFDSDWTGEPDGDPKKLIAEVMQLPELDREKTIVRWRLREDLFSGRKKRRETPEMDFSWLQTVGVLIANLFEPLLWLLAAILLALVIRAFWRHLPDSAPERSEPVLPERILGLDVKPESLPEDVPAMAEQLWRDGEKTAAMSLLYRGALVRLVQEGLSLRESFTENDCLRVARQGLASERVGFLTELTRTWQRVAYAHRVPQSEVAQRLWSTWNQHFRVRANAHGGETP